ncbi:hypothetical protein APR04_005726 [Promicromonospora umidemergens]|uniref:Alkylmercury lyase-like protein n=1 Tax=Promicromonospora umidemergens TaxID=629679 RepID=A0ABP8XZP4_9MICO|nr:hypothetical protein [Promicromonospora umidemergens]MCP2286786.1 hypothetical protein [Promicromonospora umidemergens]
MTLSDSSQPISRRVQVLQVPDCPLVDGLLNLIRNAGAETGIQVDVQVVVGDYPSPTLVIDGLDGATGRPVATTTCCRLDLPTHEQITAALAP